MASVQKFYVFDEHTDYVKECKKIGMMPIGNEIPVKSFEYDGAKQNMKYCLYTSAFPDGKLP